MKKLFRLLSTMLVLCLLAACGGEPVSTPAAGSATSTAGEGGEEELFFDPSQFQVTALDDNTLEVKLVARTPYFLELTAFPAYMPVQQATVEANGEAWAVDASTYVSNGPFMITEWLPGSHITMEKNPNYWEADKIGPDKIVFHLIEDDVAQLNAYQNGELLFVDSVPQEEIPNLRSDPTFHVDSQLGTYYVSFNNQIEPFDDPLVRQAFSLAIDRQHIADVIGAGNYIPAGAWVPPGLTDSDPTKEFRDVGGDFYDPYAAAYAANLTKAKELLAEAGYPNGEGLPTIEYIYNDTTLHAGVAEALQDMWSELGATVTIEVQEWNTFLNTRKNGEFMAARDGWLNDYNDPIGVLDLFITGSGNNNSQYSNPEYDALISEIKVTEDNARRFELMHQAEEILMNDWVFAPIMYYGDPYMMAAELEDTCWASPLGYKYFMYAAGISELPVCVGPDPDTIDPALNSSVDGATMIIHAFEGLYRLDQNGTPVPGLAESVDISEDGLTYTFHLREGLMWSDGTPLTANDFVYSWTRAIDPATAADYGYMYECIAGYNEALALGEEEDA